MHGMVSLLIASLTALSPAVGQSSSAVTASGGATSTPAPTVSFVSNSPVLIQQGTDNWVTSIVVDVFPACMLDISYKLVTASPSEAVTGKVTSVKGLGPNQRDAAGIPVTCGQKATIPAGAPATAQGYEVDLAFLVQFATVPLRATLVLSKPRGLATIPSVTLTLQRQVTLTDYLGIPALSGAVMMLLFYVSIRASTRRRKETGAEEPQGLDPPSFWKKPAFASAAWTFKDSWATNLTVGVAAISAVLAAAGSVSTVFPGVKLDRYAILMAACAAVIAIPPLIFGIINAATSGSRITLPDDSMINPAQAAKVQAIAGATMGLPIGTSLQVENGECTLSAPATVIIPPGDPGRLISLRDGWIGLPGDGTIIMSGGVKITINSQVNVRRTATDASRPIQLAGEKIITVGSEGGTMKIVGVADVTLQAETRIITPASATAVTPGNPPLSTKLPKQASLKIPTVGNVIQSDMRAVIPAALVTMFGIGAELGILGVLAFWLSAENGPARIAALLFLFFAGVIVVVYAGLTTKSLADAQPGSALSVSSTSFTY